MNDFFAVLMDPEGNEVGLFRDHGHAEEVAALLNLDRPGYWVKDGGLGDELGRNDPDTDDEDAAPYLALAALSL